MGDPSNPAELQPYDTAWPDRADEERAAISDALTGLDGVDAALIDHIGSTSVPGLAAKPFIDLQVRILPLPSGQQLTDRLGRLGYVRSHGARPDSPGVYRDIPRGDEQVPDEVWQKHILVARERAVILHVRRKDSPWGRDTVWFRDWLRVHPDERERYEARKRQLSQQNRGKADYDDYTRAKTAFFDEVQADFTSWARRQQPE